MLFGMCLRVVGRAPETGYGLGSIKKIMFGRCLRVVGPDPRCYLAQVCAEATPPVDSGGATHGSRRCVTPWARPGPAKARPWP